MQPQIIMQAQIDSALAGLTRIREQLAGAGTADNLNQIGHDLDWAASHLDDIRHIWDSLKSEAISRNLGQSPCASVVSTKLVRQTGGKSGARKRPQLQQGGNTLSVR